MASSSAVPFEVPEKIDTSTSEVPFSVPAEVDPASSVIESGRVTATTTTAVTDTVQVAGSGDSSLWTNKKIALGDNTEITVTTQSTVPSGSVAQLTLYEDVGSNSTGTQVDENGEAFNNSTTVDLGGGTETHTLTGFDGTGKTNTYWAKISLNADSSSLTAAPPSVEKVVVEPSIQTAVESLSASVSASPSITTADSQQRVTESVLWTSKKVLNINSGSINVLTDTTLPYETTAKVTVYEDIGGDNTGPNTDELGNAYNNSASITLYGGKETNQLNVFDTTFSENNYWAKIVLKSSGSNLKAAPPSINKLEIDEAARAVSGTPEQLRSAFETTTTTTTVTTASESTETQVPSLPELSDFASASEGIGIELSASTAAGARNVVKQQASTTTTTVVSAVGNGPASGATSVSVSSRPFTAGASSATSSGNIEKSTTAAVSSSGLAGERATTSTAFVPFGSDVGVATETPVTEPTLSHKATSTSKANESATLGLSEGGTLLELVGAAQATEVDVGLNIETESVLPERAYAYENREIANDTAPNAIESGLTGELPSQTVITNLDIAGFGLTAISTEVLIDAETTATAKSTARAAGITSAPTTSSIVASGSAVDSPRATLEPALLLDDASVIQLNVKTQITSTSVSLNSIARLFRSVTGELTDDINYGSGQDNINYDSDQEEIIYKEI